MAKFTSANNGAEAEQCGSGDLCTGGSGEVWAPVQLALRRNGDAGTVASNDSGGQHTSYYIPERACENSKLRGTFDMRREFVGELRNSTEIDKNLADTSTHCQPSGPYNHSVGKLKNYYSTIALIRNRQKRPMIGGFLIIFFN